MATKIEWCQETWNVTTGCTPVSPACEHCYAARLASGRLKHHRHYKGLSTGGKWTGEVRCNADILEAPLHWRKPRMIFVSSTGDLFHPDVPAAFIAQVMQTILMADQHQFLILTKRPEVMAAWFSTQARFSKVLGPALGLPLENLPPIENLWLGVTAENQEQADKRIPILLEIPAAVRFVSVEPMLGAVDIRRYLDIEEAVCKPVCPEYGDCDAGECGQLAAFKSLDWCICGGESGPGARPMHPDWAKSLRDQCKAAGVPFFFKQQGVWVPSDEVPSSHAHFNEVRCVGKDPCRGKSVVVNNTLMVRIGKKAAGRLLDGKEYNEYPAGHRPAPHKDVK